ncbi:DUF6907 domain-containing protein [Aeromicrobium alkaliterrae]|uniref:Uncharacterized protein n=1 Tax=Aeromicrobium alkaliterrae TaxID=302168 RepID=A0ABN2JYA1_9ACTN
MDREPPARPSWQAAPCPPWCVVTHREDDPPADRRHESAAQSLPVTLAGDSPAELFVALSRLEHEPVEWVFVGQAEIGGQHLHVSRESAHRLAQALLDLSGASIHRDL